MYALNNKRSHQNLCQWVSEINVAGKTRPNVFEFDPDNLVHSTGQRVNASSIRLRGRVRSDASGLDVAHTRVPMLLVGNKADQVSEHTTMGPVLDGLEYNTMHMSALDPATVRWEQWDHFLTLVQKASLKEK